MAKITEELVIEASDKILDVLLEYKKQHPDFTFWLRTRDIVRKEGKADGEKRLEKGYWFQGSHYIFLGFYKQGDSFNKTRTFGFVVSFGNPEEPVNYIEWVFNNAKPHQIPFYNKLSEVFSGAEKIHDKKFKYRYNDNDFIKNLKDFLQNQKPKMDAIINELGLQSDFFIPEEKFQNSLSKTLELRAKLKNPSNELMKAVQEPVEDVKDLNIILYGPPGTGKTYNSINHALSIIEDVELDEIDELPRDEVRKRFDSYMSQGQIEMVTFHQSLSYEDFIEGIKPVSEADSPDQLQYKVVPGIFKEIVDRAKFLERDNFDKVYDKFIAEMGESALELKTPKQSRVFEVTINSSDNCTVQPKTETATKMVVTREMVSKYLRTGEIVDWKPYTISISEYIRKKYDYRSSWSKNDPSSKKFVLIIDEINRGNVAQIFGELITLIEPDKRLGVSESLEITLPYSKEKFGVPSNLYIIGTMNTADRSVEALDTALRRRFSFVEMPPRYDFEEFEEDFGGVTPLELLTTINQRLEKLLSKDHLIGHSYFLGANSLEYLKDVFQRKIIPLLQEYFYGDFGKIGLVLGTGFFHELKDNASDMNFFAEFNHYDVNDLLEKPVYRLKEPISMSDEEFETALKILMRRNG